MFVCLFPAPGTIVRKKWLWKIWCL